MRIVIVNHPQYQGQIFAAAHFQGHSCLTTCGKRFYANQWRVARTDEVGEKLNPDLAVEVAK